MPIPTRNPSVRPRTEGATATTTRIASSKRTRSVTEQVDPQDDGDKGSDVSTRSGTINPNASSGRVPLRPPSGSKQAPGVVKPTRPLSANTSTSRSTSESLKTTSRPTPASSTITRSTVNTQSRIAAPSTRLKPESNTSRIRSTSTTTTNTTKSSANTTSKLKSTSTISAPSRVARSLKDTTTTTTNNSTNSSQAKPSSSSSTVTKPEPPNPPSRLLDDELFQLRLLHSNSNSTLHHYKTSIQTRLTHKQAHLQSLETQVLALEAENTQAQSVNALAAWLDTTSNPKSQQKQTQIQSLSSAIQDLENLTTSALLPLHQFDDWITHTLTIREDRKSSSLPPSSSITTTTTTTNDLTFIQSLGHTWSESMHELQRTLTSILTLLCELSGPEQQKGEESDNTNLGISIILAKQREFASTLLQEVEIAMSIEKEIMRNETAWESAELEKAMGELLKGDSGNGNDGVGVYQGVWA